MDNRPIGQIKNGKTEQFDIEPGEHTLRVRVMRKHSSEKIIAADPHAIVQFECGPAGPAATALFDAIFRRNDYLRLERLQPE